MIEKLKYANISSIYTKELIFYNKAVEGDCISLCERNGISYLPDSNRKSCWKLESGTFRNVELSEVFTIAPTELIFSQSTLQKFSDAGIDEVLFVVEDERVVAVVHVVDYNNPFIQFECFKAISQFERSIRNLLKVEGESNQSFLEWCRIQVEEHWLRIFSQFVPDKEKDRRRIEKNMADLSEFQMFNLSDILSFGIAKGILPKHWGSVLNDGDKLHSISQLRNFIAHNKDFTNVEIREGSSPLFSIRGLQKFAKHFGDFVQCFEYVEDHVGLHPNNSLITRIVD